MDAFSGDFNKSFKEEKQQITHRIREVSAEIQNLTAKLTLLSQKEQDCQSTAKKSEDLKQQCAELVTLNHGTVK